MIDALIDRLPNQIFQFAVVGSTVDARKRHAAEANGGDRETLSAEWPARDSFHLPSPSSVGADEHLYMLRRWHTRVTSGETFLTMVSEGPPLTLPRLPARAAEATLIAPTALNTSRLIDPARTPSTVLPRLW